MPVISPRMFGAAIFGALIAALIMGSVILFIRGDRNAQIEVLLPVTEQIEAISDSEGTAAGNTSGAPGALTVHISGAVLKSGVYTLPPGSRLIDAVEAAGGTTLEASDRGVNLAQPLRDGEQYHISALGDAPLAASNQGLETKSTGYCDSLIDLNNAPKDLLETLPGIGEKRADDIVSFREEFGPFQSVEEITNVDGIGESTYESILALTTVCEPR